MINIHDCPETARPAGESFISMAEACERWPVAFAQCLAKLDGLAAAHRASTALFPRTNGIPHLFLWADAPGIPGFEIAGLAELPPDLATVREIIHEAAA